MSSCQSVRAEQIIKYLTYKAGGLALAPKNLVLSPDQVSPDFWPTHIQFVALGSLIRRATETPREGPMSCLFSMQRGKFLPSVFIWVRDRPWASIGVCPGPNNSPEGDVEWCFSGITKHSLSFLHLEVLTWAGKKTRSGSVILCYPDADIKQQSDWWANIAKIWKTGIRQCLVCTQPVAKIVRVNTSKTQVETEFIVEDHVGQVE